MAHNDEAFAHTWRRFIGVLRELLVFEDDDHALAAFAPVRDQVLDWTQSEPWVSGLAEIYEEDPWPPVNTLLHQEV